MWLYSQWIYSRTSHRGCTPEDAHNSYVKRQCLYKTHAYSFIYCKSFLDHTEHLMKVESMQWLYGCILHILGIMIRKMYIPVQDRYNLYFLYGWIPRYKIYSMESQPYFAAWFKNKANLWNFTKSLQFYKFYLDTMSIPLSKHQWSKKVTSNMLVAQLKGLCAHRSPEKPGMSCTQDALSNGKDVNKQTTQTKQICSSIQKSGAWKGGRVLWPALPTKPYQPPTTRTRGGS